MLSVKPASASWLASGSAACENLPGLAFLKKKKEVFIWLYQVLVSALRIFSLSCSMQTLSHGMWDPTWAPLHWELRVLATGPPSSQPRANIDERVLTWALICHSILPFILPLRLPFLGFFGISSLFPFS